MRAHPLKIYIDSCAVNLLMENSVDITEQFPAGDYQLVITKGVRKELLDIPEGRPIRGFALSLMESPIIIEESLFGYGDLRGLETTSRHMGGYDTGNLANNEQIAFLGKTLNNIGSAKNSKPRKNETDRDLIVQAIDAVILTKENRLGGALQEESKAIRTLIVNIAKWPPAEMSLKEYVELKISSSL